MTGRKRPGVRCLWWGVGRALRAQPPGAFARPLPQRDLPTRAATHWRERGLTVGPQQSLDRRARDRRRGPKSRDCGPTSPRRPPTSVRSLDTGAGPAASTTKVTGGASGDRTEGKGCWDLPRSRGPTSCLPPTGVGTLRRFPSLGARTDVFWCVYYTACRWNYGCTQIYVYTRRPVSRYTCVSDRTPTHVREFVCELNPYLWVH